MQHFSRWLIAIIVVLGLGGIAFLWWQKQQMQIQTQTPIAAVPVPSTEPVVQAPEPPASQAANYPIEAVAAQQAASSPLPPLAMEDDVVRDALIGLMGRQAVLSYFDLHDFAGRVVATIDNLGRPHASARL
jgi:cytoskeletal protein RodZ